MQYFRPDDPYYVGDCMPFFHEGTFHFYYLQDENHHRAKGGLGGHQWAHSASKDLIHWEHYPLAIACTEDWEGSICTGSPFYHEGTFYGFYATRMPDRSEKLSIAVSKDGITFEKTEPNPFASPPEGYMAKHYRDPFVFADETTDEFHMLVTASLEQPDVHNRGGCLLRLTSTDLMNWQVAEPFLIPGGTVSAHNAVPECPDYFFWNGWYYLVFSLDGTAHYRMSKNAMGPWLRPAFDTFDSSIGANVMKTAAFNGDRRIGVVFLTSRRDDKDDGDRMYGGNAVFREIFQQSDGTLGTKFPSEMVPAYGDKLELPYLSLTAGATGSAQSVHLEAPEGFEAAALEDLPRNARIVLTVTPGADTTDFGLSFRGSGRMEKGYELHFLPEQKKATFIKQVATPLDGLGQPFSIEIVLKDDIIDICIDQRCCLIDRCPELTGDRLFFFCHNGSVTFDSIEISPLL